ncbi:MAG: acyltransferase [Acidiferrobacterales bacterium]|nr:acyltransferase [Acidiferrobacterales bacterium]
MKNNVLRISLFLITCITVHQLVQVFAMQSFNVMQIKGQFPTGTQIYFSNSNGFHPIIKKTAVGNTVAETAETQVLNFQLSNRLVERFQVDIAHGELPHKLEQIGLYSHFSRKPELWSGAEIGEKFELTQYRQGTITSYTLKHKTKGSNGFIEYIVPVLVGLLVALTLGTTNWSAFPPIQDLGNSIQIRHHHSFTALDGLRGLAALLVLMHHATITFKGYGGLGVWIFFVLSGFLLTRSFVVKPNQANSISSLAKFMARRFKRIVPMYYVMITVIFLLQNHFDTAIRHYLFIQGEGHYWTILQEMYFYLLLPFLTLACYLLFRGRILPSLLFLGLLTFLWNKYGDSNVFSIYGLNQPLRGFFQVFLLGMIGAYWYHGIYINSKKLQRLCERYQWVLSITALLVLAAVLEISRIENWVGFSLTMNHHPLIGGLVCLALILLAVVGSPKCLYKKILNNPLIRYVGIVGYSFYLLHPYAIFMIRHAIEHYFDVPYLNVGEFWQLFAGFILTLILASVTYTTIERPFLRKAQ